MIKGARELHPNSSGLEFECYDFYEYNDDHKYDFIIFYNAYPHFLDRSALSKKANSLLKENGKLVIAHGMSREALFKHHMGVSNHISRVLEAPNEEYEAYVERFELENWADNEEYYLMVLKKK